MTTGDEFVQQFEKSTRESLIKGGLVEPNVLDQRNVPLGELLEPAGLRDRVPQDAAEHFCVFFCGDTFVIILPAEGRSGGSTIHEVRQVADDIEI